MAPRSKASTTSTRKRAKCFSGSQSCRDGGSSSAWFTSEEPKTLSHGRILTAYTLWKSCYVWYFCRIYSRQTPRADIRRWGPCFQLRLRQDDELWLAAAAHVVDRAGIEGAGIVLVA